MNEYLKTDLMLAGAAVIWGGAFVAQRIGMEHVGPYTFNGIRFLMGGILLLPLFFRLRNKKNTCSTGLKGTFLISMTAGLALFAGASFQQTGLIYTTAGNAGFITGLYVVLVPLLGLFFHQKTNAYTWIGAFLATTGLYLLSATDAYTISYGDIVVLTGTFFWAAHVLVVGWLVGRFDSLHIAIVQYTTCSLLSLAAAVGFEEIHWGGISGCTIPILYGGILSVGLGYTLQVIAQKKAHPAHTAIILSFESVIAAIAGHLLLSEVLTFRQTVGCALMLLSMLVSQWRIIFSRKPLAG